MGPDEWARDPRCRAAVARFVPGESRFRRLLAGLVSVLCQAVMRGGNRLRILGGECLPQARATGRGLLTFSNHVALFDDPLLTACMDYGDWHGMRWIAADAVNFFGGSLRSVLFNAGKCVPVVRGAGWEQPGMDFLAERLRLGDWVHVFPEGGRTRVPGARLQRPFKPGMARLIRASRPLLLPFHHLGMEAVMPLGAWFPRLGKPVRVHFGELVDSAEGLAERTLEEITAWAEEVLGAMEQRAAGGP